MSKTTTSGYESWKKKQSAQTGQARSTTTGYDAWRKKQDVKENKPAKSYAEWKEKQKRRQVEDYIASKPQRREYVEQRREYLQQESLRRQQAEYERAVKNRKARETAVSRAMEDYDRDISVLENALEEYQVRSRTMQDQKGEERLAYLRSQYGEIDELKNRIGEARRKQNTLRRTYDAQRLAGAGDPNSEYYDPDFDKYSGYRSSEHTDKLLGFIPVKDEDITYEYINADAPGKHGMEQKYRDYLTRNVLSKGYGQMTDEEVALYNYHYAKSGREGAERYLDTIQERLNQRQGQIVHGNVGDGILPRLGYGAIAGYDQFKSGMEGMDDALEGKDSYVPPSSWQYASGLVREDLEKSGPKLPEWLGGASLGQMAYDTVTTTANMAPSILTSMVMDSIAPGSGSYVGSGMMGASAAGSAYQEAIGMGADVNQARAYGTLVGASEAVLGELLGGIKSLGGKLSGKAVSSVMSKVDNALLRAAGELGGKMLSEFSEEYLHEVLTPWFQNITMDMQNEVSLLSPEAVYSGLLGALSAGVLEGGPTIAEGISRSREDQMAAEAPVAGKEQNVQPETMDVWEEPGTQESAVLPEGTVRDSRTVEDGFVPDTDVGDTGEGTSEDIPFTMDDAPAVEASVETVQQTEEKTVTDADQDQRELLEKASEKYGAQAGAMVHTWHQDQNVEQYDAAYRIAYDMGRSGVRLDYVKKAESTGYLTDTQKEFAWEAGRAASGDAARSRQREINQQANGNTGWRKGTVRGQDVTIADMAKAFNDPQRRAYKTLSTIAEVSGVDIVLYASDTDSKGVYQGEQGRFQWNDNAIYIDINAGLKSYLDAGSLASYTMMRTFGHEFTHFIEKWNPEDYNDFRETVLGIMEDGGIPVDERIELMVAKSDGALDYEKASRELVAEGMTDIFEESGLVEQLAQKNRNVFRKLLEKLKEFVADLKAHFAAMTGSGKEAQALKRQMGDSVRYMEDVVRRFDEAAVRAVENYQRTVATEEVAESEAHTEQEASVVKEQSTEPYRSANGYTVAENPEYGSLEVSFDEKPDAIVRDALKANKFRWNGKKKIWYGKTGLDVIVDALDKAYEASSRAEPETQQESSQEKPVSDFETAFWNATQAERDEVTDAIRENTNISRMKPTEIHKETVLAENKEADNNGKESENGLDEPAVHEPVRRGERTPRLLEGVEPEPVQSGGGGREPVRTGEHEGTKDAGRDRRADAAGDVPVRSQGDRLGGDLQQLPAVTEDPEPAQEMLHEEVERQVGRRSTVTPKGSNYAIGDDLNLPKGTKARTRANLEAIRVVKQLTAENRYATPAEQETLSKYVGWGGLADAFGKPVSNRATRKLEYEPVAGLEEEFDELKQLLTEEEYKAARESTKNAHYTSVEVIRAMYDTLSHLGFTGGRMLEPSAGVGNFVGAMPAQMTASVKSWTMVELDSITGQIAKYLYPNSDVRIQGFEQTNIPDGYMDVAIGNVPFGNYGVTDKHYPKAVTGAIHNYFFAKALDKVRPGGLVMFITSRYTMDSRENAMRRYMVQRADLLGAVRLPNTAFAGNAGTSVVTDILILKKRSDRTAYAGEQFENVTWQGYGSGGAAINEYFVQHPEMVLGEFSVGRGMYGPDSLTVNPYADRGTLGDQIREATHKITGRMDYAATMSPEKSNLRQVTVKKKARKLTVQDGQIHTRDENGTLQKVETDADTAERIIGMVGIRDAHTALCDALQQGLDGKTVDKLRGQLNGLYDAFVAKYGHLNAPKNRKAINAFSDRYAILSLEHYTPKTGKAPATAVKADIFTKNTIAPNRTAAKAENVEEGLTISLNTVGNVDTSMIARLTGEKVESVTRQLIDQRLVFKDKDGNLIPAAQYLSGNVRAKLRQMEGLVGIDPDYRNNVEALKEVVPPTVEHADIYVSPGASWVPVQVYEDFVAHILDRHNHKNWRTGKNDFTVEYVAETNEYKVSINDAYAKSGARNTQVWGESGKSFATIFENMLNGRRTSVYMDGPDGKRVLDRVRTEAVAVKAEKLGEEFRRWLWEDESRRKDMQELYNESYNSLVPPKFSGDGLMVNGMNSAYSLRPHQADAVARIINSGGNTLLAHRVGAGKTMEMAAAAMKLKQLGVIKKPMFVVPNNVVAQWGKEFKDYFPAANILLVGDEDMTPAERMTTINRIKSNDYDAVILAYTKFEKIQMTKAWRQKFYEEQINGIMFAINAEKENQNGKGFTVKQLETKRKQLEAKVKKLTDKEKDEDGAMFEDLGVDALFVDEAHNFKNLEYSTRMNNVSGLGNADGSQRAFDLYTKVRYLQQLNGGRGIVFATATPVMNSMTEMYIMQRYLQPDTLKQLGIDNFDAWAKMFGEVVNTLEIAPSGSGYRVKQTFSKFKNVKALQQLFRSFTDVMTEVPGLKIPKMKGGRVQIVECEQGQFQKEFMEELAQRAENVKNVDPSEDNMLKITSDGRKISYSQRMIDPGLPYEENGKIYRCCENVWRVYQESRGSKGTQMIFCDMATPKGKATGKTEADTGEFDAVDGQSAQLYDDIKERLVQLGIPVEEIAFIHDAKNDRQKAALSEKMNNGTIRVLLGSTGKMGVGLNAQVKAVAIHHLDAPWRPGDIEQRDGRVFRQKNENSEAYKFVYVTKGSFDSRLWDILERKQKFINQVMNGDDVGNEIEDTGEVTLSAAEVKAVASGNPLIAEQVALEKEVSRLESLQQAHLAGVNRAKEMTVKVGQRITMLEKRVEDARTDIKKRKAVDCSEKGFSITIGGQSYADRKEAGIALAAAAQAKAKEGSYATIGQFAGFALRVVKEQEGISGVVAGAGNYGFKVYPLNTTRGINHLISVVQGLDGRLTEWESSLAETRRELTLQKELAVVPFEQAEQLRQKRSRYREIMDILNPPPEQQVSDEQVQYQRRYPEYSNEPSTAREWSVFNRSFANKTSGLKNGEIRNIMITTGDHVYFVKADGYMSGQIVSKMNIDQELDKINAYREAFVNAQTDTDRKTPDQWAEGVRDGYGRDHRNHGGAGYAGEAEQDAGMDAEPSEGDSLGGYWGNYGYSSYEELIDAVRHGSMVMDDDGNLIQVADDSDAQYQARSERLTDREVLSYAAREMDPAALNEAERSALEIFQGRLTHLEELQRKRQELGVTYREQQFSKPADREGASKTLTRMKEMDRKIDEAGKKVLDVEQKDVLRQVLKHARSIVEREQKSRDDQTLKRWRDRRRNADAIRKYRERIGKDVDDLTDWTLRPDNKNAVKHLPEALRKTVIPFLSGIDLSSKQYQRSGKPTQADERFFQRLDALKKAMTGQSGQVDELYADFADLPPDFMEKLNRFASDAQEIARADGSFNVNRMTAEELKNLSEVVRNLKTFVQNFNRFHQNAMFGHVDEAGDSTVEELADMKPAKHSGKATEFLFWQHMRPAYVFERFGEGGRAIYKELTDGQAKLAFNTKEILAFAKDAYTPDEVRAWEKDVREITLSNGETIHMTIPQIMSFYELCKREQALGHILGEGIRAAAFKRKRKYADTGHRLTDEDLNAIIGQLNDRQKKVADELQKFMQEKGGAWGNHVSMARFGEKQFGEEHYFPIHSDGRHLADMAEEHPQAASMYALLNMGFTKQLRENARNRIVIYSIFDVFSNHMASMAQYNAMALPVVDALKWFNYRQTETDEDGSRIITGSVREEMDRVYGVAEENTPGSGNKGYAQRFVAGIIRAYNGTEAQGTPYDNFGLKALHRYNRAQVAFNLRSAIQQPLAVVRAAQILDGRSVIRGMKLSPKAIRKNIEEMERYSGIAAWKGLGFYDVNISRGLTTMIKQDESLGDKVTDAGMWAAEKADLLTWAAMWSAAKEDVILKQGMKPGQDGFYEAVSARFEEVVYKTQVVDSVLTKSAFMRDKGFFARASGAFMSEPVATASMVLDAYDRYQRDLQHGMSRPQAWKKNGRNIARTIAVYAVGQTLLAAVQSFPDAWRDDDEDQEYWEKWLEAFRGNVLEELIPFNKLPIVSDFYEVIKEILSQWTELDVYGNAPQSVYMQWYDVLVKGSEILHDKVSGKDTSYTWYGAVYKLLQALSGASGLPFANVTREVIGIWNNTVVQMAPSLRVVTPYDPGQKKQIQYAYKDGWLTDEEAVAALTDEEALAVYDEEALPKEDAWAKVEYWKFTMENPNLEITEDSLTKWRGELKDSGLTVEQYLDFLALKKSLPEGHKKEDVLKIINKMKITSKQKDALYRAQGYAESTLDEAPWH